MLVLMKKMISNEILIMNPNGFIHQMENMMIQIVILFLNVRNPEHFIIILLLMEQRMFHFLTFISNKFLNLEQKTS
jgi:hypothetical protein